MFKNGWLHCDVSIGNVLIMDPTELRSPLTECVTFSDCDFKHLCVHDLNLNVKVLSSQNVYPNVKDF